MTPANTIVQRIIPSAKPTDEARAALEQALTRYTQEQQEAIVAYLEELRWTRGTGKVSLGVILREMDYWSRYAPDLVIRALKIHTAKYPDRPEDYTRGIIRNLARENQMRPHSRERLKALKASRRPAQGRYIDGNAGNVPF